VAQSSQCLRPILTRHANIQQHTVMAVWCCWYRASASPPLAASHT
jgi:hypothetical protein